MSISNLFDRSDLSAPEAIPIEQYSQELDCFVMKSGEKYMDIVQIMSFDLISANDQEKDYMNMQWTKFYKTCSANIKQISLNFPADTGPQQQYYKHKIQKCNNPVHKALLQKKLAELVYIEKHRTEREYYMMFFADSEQEFLDIRDLISSTLYGNGLCQEMTQAKKEMIIYKYNNPNTAVFVGTEDE